MQNEGYSTEPLDKVRTRGEGVESRPSKYCQHPGPTSHMGQGSLDLSLSLVLNKETFSLGPVGWSNTLDLFIVVVNWV